MNVESFTAPPPVTCIDPVMKDGAIIHPCRYGKAGVTGIVLCIPAFAGTSGVCV